MQEVKKTAEYTIFKKKNGRYAVKGANRQWVNGEEKTKILLANDLIKVSAPGPAATPAEEAAPADETQETITEEASPEA